MDADYTAGNEHLVVEMDEEEALDLRDALALTRPTGVRTELLYILEAFITQRREDRSFAPGAEDASLEDPEAPIEDRD